MTTGQKLPLIVSIIFFVFISFSCKSEAPVLTDDEKNAALLDEQTPIEIPLPDLLSGREIEISGLTWFNEELIILPQYPSKIGEENNSIVFGISKKNILSYLQTKDEEELQFYKIQLIEDGLKKYSKTGSGYEAITFIGNSAYLTIEHMDEDKTLSLMVSGNLDFENKTLTLDSSSIKKIICEEDIYNLSNETITRFGEKLIPMYEANGISISDEPRISVFNNQLGFEKFLSLPNIEYRVTDATTADSSGKFWVMNYFYPGDYKKLKPTQDYITKNFGTGQSHKNSTAVERIVALQITAKGIQFADENPIYIKLLDNGKGRNWEGLAKLDDKGFIIATDTFPKTILAFVPVESRVE